MTEAFLHDWSSSRNEQDALDAMIEVSRVLDCSGVMITYSPTGWLPSNEPGLIHRILQSGMDERQLQHWMGPAAGQRLQVSPFHRKFDPIRRRMVKQTLPRCFDLRALMEGDWGPLTARQQLWCKHLLSHGIREVISVPVQIPPTEYWNMTLISNSPHQGSQAVSALQRAGLTYFTHGLVQFCIEQLHWRESGSRDRQMSLRPRERDCLYWAAMGKSAAETAEILDLRTETVRKYLKAALSRLDARNKVQAVTKAVQWGLLALSGDEPS
ncbi:helix-turn-helix transcriptional regulator [Aestuariirhabdus litorea]|nr:LuxR C-terminal-related transcriptional regulator [Aestuariirhabdus litorea]